MNKTEARGVYYKKKWGRTESAGGQEDCASTAGGSGELIIAGGEGQSATEGEFEVGGVIDSNLMRIGQFQSGCPMVIPSSFILLLIFLMSSTAWRAASRSKGF